MDKSRLFLLVLLVLASIITLLIGEQLFDWIKAAGVLLAMLAFLPVFFMLRYVLGSGSVTKFLVIFVGGFLFKLFVVLIGIWYAVSRMSLPVVEFVVSCLVFLLALQIYEAIYFWSKGGSSVGMNSN